MESATAAERAEALDANGSGIAVENPATGETLATVPDVDAAGVARVVDAARAAQPA